jgi:hypothetical protein
MPTLLDSVIATHGGQERWNQFTTLTARYQVGGPFWAAKGQPDFLGDELAVLDLRSQEISFTRQDGDTAGRVIEFDNDALRVRVTDGNGQLIAKRRDRGPRSSVTTGTRRGMSRRRRTSSATQPGITSTSRSCSPTPACRQRRSSRGPRTARPGAYFA